MGLLYLYSSLRMPIVIHNQLIFRIWHKRQKCQGDIIIIIIIIIATIFLYLPRGDEESFVNCNELAGIRVCRNLLISAPPLSFQTDMTWLCAFALSDSVAHPKYGEYRVEDRAMAGYPCYSLHFSTWNSRKSGRSIMQLHWGDSMSWISWNTAALSFTFGRTETTDLWVQRILPPCLLQPTLHAPPHKYRLFPKVRDLFSDELQPY